MLKDVLPFLPNLNPAMFPSVTNRSNRPPSNQDQIRNLKSRAMDFDRFLNHYYYPEDQRDDVGRISIISAYMGYCGEPYKSMFPDSLGQPGQPDRFAWTDDTEFLLSINDEPNAMSKFNTALQTMKALHGTDFGYEFERNESSIIIYLRLMR